MSDLKSAQRFDAGRFEQGDPASVLQQAQQFSAAQFVPAALPAASTETVADAAAPHGVGQTTAATATVPWLLYIVLGLTGALALLQWGDFVWQSWQHSPLQGAAASALTLTGGLLLARTLYRSWRSRRQLAKRQALRLKGAQILQSLQYGEAATWLAQACQQLPASQLQQFRAQQQAHLSDSEVLQLFDVLVLQPQDQQAQHLIRQAASQTALAVAVSPFALADLALVSWRSLKLMDEIGTVYGVNASLWQRGRLLKAFLQALFWTGSTELAVDLGGDLLGAELSSKLSARAGQGILAGLLVGRLGRYACAEYRPLALPADNRALKPLLAELVARLLTGRDRTEKTGPATAPPR